MLKVRTVGLKYMTGSTLSPMLCFLVLRGLKRLALRMRQHSDNALRIAQFLEAHPKVKAVTYPMLETGPRYAIARVRLSVGLEDCGDLLADLEQALATP